MLDRVGDKYLGFTVNRIRSSEELGGRLVEMTFDRTGTELCWMDNGETNKLFSVTFKTVPEDSTGVFHILEHSVLCGSDKYPVREPFVELLKSSMNTFLNAMTFPDKTMYPVSSRNDRDFLNLTGVYLDAVFAPAILRDPNIFYQEGWHIENLDGDLAYKGVVFNEMKGAMSGVDRILEEEVMEHLFPDTCYGFNSGGDPTVIPDLTYTSFCETYRRFYHPSNARIYLDGQIPLAETFALLKTYLDGFDRSDRIPSIEMQTPRGGSFQCQYELAREDDPKDKSHLAMGLILCDWQDREKALAAQVLLDAVAGSNESPLKRAILSSGLVQEMDAGVEDGIAQPFLYVHFKNVLDGKEKELLSLLYKTAREMARNGLDNEALQASANRLEYRLRDLEEPAGLERCILSMNSWLYGGDPMQYLTLNGVFSSLKKHLTDGSMETLLTELFSEDARTVSVCARPSHHYGDEMRKSEADRLAMITSGWTEKDHENNRILCEKLIDWQQTPDTPERLATIPVLGLDEIGTEPIVTETRISVTDGVTVLYHPVKTGGITHLGLYFSLADRSLSELSLLSYAGDFMGEIGTTRRDALSLQNALKNTVGNLDFSVSATAEKGQTKTCVPVFVVQCSVLNDKIDEAVRLILEILLETDLGQKEQIREILQQTDEQNKQVGIRSGHSICVSSVLSHCSSAGAVLDAVSGYTAIRALRGLPDDNDRFDAFLALMKDLREKNFVSSRLTVSVTSDEERDVSRLIAGFPKGEPAPAFSRYTSSLPRKMGCRIPAQIGFSAQGFNIGDAGIPYNGAMRVAANLVSLNLMWGTVRVQGGAYGTGLKMRSTGSVTTYSYRDPTPVKSIGVNQGISAFIRSFCEGEEPLDKYIISTVAATEPLRSPAGQGYTADMDWFAGYTREDLKRDRLEMLSVTRDKMLEDRSVWEKFAENGAICVIGFEKMLSEDPELTILEL